MDKPDWISTPLWSGVIGVISFMGGLLTRLLDRVIPSYTNLVDENVNLRKQNNEQADVITGLRDKIEGLEDAVDEDDRKPTKGGSPP